MEPVLETAVKLIWALFKGIFKNFIQKILSKLTVFVLKIVNILDLMVKYLIGVDRVNNGIGLAENLLQKEEVRTLVTILITISFSLTYALVAKQLMTNMVNDEKEKTPFKTLTKKATKCWGKMGMTFFYCTVLIYLVSTGASSLMKATTLNPPSIANVFFAVGACNAIKSGDKNEVIKMYMNANDSVHSFENESQVELDFEYKDINYLSILVLAFAGLWTLLSLVFMLSRRVFLLVTLYATGPMFAALSLIDDDDKKYRNWQSLFIAEFVSVLLVLIGYSIFAIMTYEIIVADIVFVSSAIVNSILTLVIVVILMIAVPDSVSFGYNLITDQGRFLSRDTFSLAKLRLRNIMGLGG